MNPRIHIKVPIFENGKKKPNKPKCPREACGYPGRWRLGRPWPRGRMWFSSLATTESTPLTVRAGYIGIGDIWTMPACGDAL